MVLSTEARKQCATRTTFFFLVVVQPQIHPTEANEAESLSTAKTTHIAGSYKGKAFSARNHHQLDFASQQSSSFTSTFLSSTSVLIITPRDMNAFKKTASTSTTSATSSTSSDAGKAKGSQQDKADKSYPQCCHCSWRNAHSPDCIFYTGNK